MAIILSFDSFFSSVKTIAKFLGAEICQRHSGSGLINLVSRRGKLIAKIKLVPGEAKNYLLKDQIVIFNPEEVFGCPLQRIWAEVMTRDRGFSLIEQLVQYPEMFPRASKKAVEKNKKQPLSTAEDLDPTHQLRLLELMLQNIKKVSSGEELQKLLVIKNANEFRLRDTPSRRDFELIISDFIKWELAQISQAASQTEAEYQKLVSLIRSVINAARRRFRQIQQE